MRKCGIILALALIPLTAVVYFLKGKSQSYLTQSYFFEKRLRHLLFLETHEPVDYGSVAGEYEKLLRNIRFGSKTNQSAIYEKALARTKISIQIISHLRQYNATQNFAELKKAHRLYTQVLNEGLNEYGFYSLYIDNHLITEEWFRDELQKSEIKGPLT